MSGANDTRNIAVFCDFENVALGVREARYAAFDIKIVLERLLLKGSIVLKKAYCDWDRYKEFKPAMHQAAFELIEIPHVRQSGKNSADIRMVVDALDLCYTKAHVDTFVLVSGDSDFSPLVSKLRENNKTVIGLGVKNSTSDLLMSNCDEFIYYDDLLRENAASAARPGAAKQAAPKSVRKKSARKAPTASARTAASVAAPDAAEAVEASPEVVAESPDRRRAEAITLVVGTVHALQSERGEDERLWGSMVKQTLKRRRPGFNESQYGFRSFNAVLEEAQTRGLLMLERDDRSGGYVVTTGQPVAPKVE